MGERKREVGRLGRPFLAFKLEMMCVMLMCHLFFLIDVSVFTIKILFSMPFKGGGDNKAQESQASPVRTMSSQGQ